MLENGAVVSARKASVSMVQGIMMSLGMHNHNSVGIDPAGLENPASSSRSGSKANLHATTLGTSAPVVAAPVTPAPSTPHRAGSVSTGAPNDVSDAANMRILANEATNKFKIAEVEKEIEADRQKQEAAIKLSLRLKLKNKGKNAAAAPGAASIPEEGAVSGTATAATNRTAEEEEAEMHRIKVEKLRQHKLQENRRNQSMYVAKERSSQALQKRLDELAAKKKAASGASSNAIAENSGSEDSGSDDDSNE